MEGDSRQSKENSDQAITLHGQLEIASASTRSYSDSGYSSPSPATVTHTSAAQVRTTNFPFENASVDDSSATENIAGATVQDASQQSTKVAASVSFDISSPLPTADESPNNQFSSSRDSFIPAICSSMRRHSYDSLQSSLTPFRLVTELMQQRRCSDTQVPATSALPKVSGTEDIDDESRSFTRPRSASSPLVVSLTNFGETLRNMGDRFEADHVTRRASIAALQADGQRFGHRAVSLCRRAVSSLSSMRSSIHRRARASLPAILLNPREHASLTAAHEQAIATNASTAPLDDEEAANDSAADIALHDEVDGAAASAEFSDVVRIQR